MKRFTGARLATSHYITTKPPIQVPPRASLGVPPRFRARRGTGHKRALEAIKTYLTLRGWTVYVLPQAARLFGSAGIPDLLCFAPPEWRDKALWFEVKVGRDKLSSAQAAFIPRSTRAGWPVLVGDLDTIVAYCEKENSHG